MMKSLAWLYVMVLQMMESQTSSLVKYVHVQGFPLAWFGVQHRPLPNTKTSKHFPKWCISFPISLFYVLAKISWKSEQKYQSYICMKFCIKMWTKTCFRSHLYADFHEFLGWEIKATDILQRYTANKSNS